MKETTAFRAPARPMLRVDARERKSKLLELILESDLFELKIEVLQVGDYILNDRVVVERKTCVDFVLSVIDGRLFAQAAALKSKPERSLILVEGPRPRVMPAVHPRALKGALLSLAVAWRLPVIFSRDPDDSLLCLQVLAEQSQAVRVRPIRRRGFRIGSKDRQRLFVLEGLPGVGPALARSFLKHFGSVEKIVQASAKELAEVPGCGPGKAMEIRKILAGDKERG